MPLAETFGRIGIGTARARKRVVNVVVESVDKESCKDMGLWSAGRRLEGAGTGWDTGALGELAYCNTHCKQRALSRALSGADDPRPGGAKCGPVPMAPRTPRAPMARFSSRVCVWSRLRRRSRLFMCVSMRLHGSSAGGRCDLPAIVTYLCRRLGGCVLGGSRVVCWSLCSCIARAKGSWRNAKATLRLGL